MDFKALSSLRLFLKELRVFYELAKLLCCKPKSLNTKTPVMFIPGFMFSDIYLLPMILLLRKKGVRVYGWKMGVNKGYNQETKDKLMKRVDQILEKTRSQGIILIGWSMGGVYAREVAYENKKIKLVVTLATPFRIEGHIFKIIFKLLSGEELEQLNSVMERQRHYRIPALQVYTKEDGIICWKSCLSDGYDHKEVKSSHMGMPYHQVVFEILKPSP